jgi:hypothetical protein
VDPYDRRGIAARVRELLRSPPGHESVELARIARQLRVEEQELRRSIDEESPHPTIEVLAAIVQEYGVDPTWLVTGRYNTGTHRLAEADSTNAAAVLEAVVDHVAPASVPHHARSASDRAADAAP